MLNGERGVLPDISVNLPVAAAGNAECFLSSFRGIAFSFIRSYTADSDGGLPYGHRK
jgi:hypothetical protein